MGENLFELAKARYEETKDFIKGNKLWVPVFYPLMLSIAIGIVVFVFSFILLTTVLVGSASFLIDGNFNLGVTSIILVIVVTVFAIVAGMILPNCTFKTFEYLANTGQRITFKECIKLGLKGCVKFFFKSILYVVIPVLLVSLVGLILSIIPFVGLILNGLLTGMANIYFLFRFYAKELGKLEKNTLKETMPVWLPIGVIYGVSCAIPLITLLGVVVLSLGEFHFIYHLTKVNQEVIE